MDTQPDLQDLPDLPDLPEMVSATAARSLPLTRAGGQDYGSLTNSLKLLWDVSGVLREILKKILQKYSGGHPTESEIVTNYF